MRTRANGPRLSHNDQLTILQSTAADMPSSEGEVSSDLETSGSSVTSPKSPTISPATCDDTSDREQEAVDLEASQSSQVVQGKSATPLPPAIVVEGIPATVRQPEVAKHHQALFPSVSFIEVRRLPLGRVVIKCKEPKDYVKLLKPWPQEAFHRVKLNIQVPGDRPPSKQVVIRGLDSDISLQEIQDELSSQVITATKIERIKSAKTGLPTPLVRFSLQDVALADKLIKNGVTMWFLKLRVEESKQPEAVTVLQCFNCQKFGHARAACKASPRCAKCSGMHAVKECPKNREDTCCVNCGGPHAASYRGCPKYSQVLALKREKFLKSNMSANLNMIKSTTLKDDLNTPSSKTVKPTTHEKVQQPQPAAPSAPTSLKRTYAETTVRRRETAQSTQTHRLLISRLVTFVAETIIKVWGSQYDSKQELIRGMANSIALYFEFQPFSPREFEEILSEKLILDPNKTSHGCSK
ncbi:uncharacterized protein LOC143231613 [Tachypleus tridentatus]|uniref:uncharacterized protein LOC143231613 n=1 Tax=Tachypleus tridentatus TaxID=6853 RepID=UPI003FD63361